MISSRRREGRSLLRPFLVLFSLTFGASGCGEDEGTGPPPSFNPAPLPPLASARLTTEETLALSRPPVAYDPDVDLRDPAVMERLLSEGFGDVAPAPGVPVVPHTLDGGAAPLPGPNRRLLFRFVHLADTQLADDESPTRFVSFDSPGELSTAFRPHEASVCRIFEVYEDSGFVSVRAVALDFRTDGDPLAEDGRRRGVVDLGDGQALGRARARGAQRRALRPDRTRPESSPPARPDALRPRGLSARLRATRRRVSVGARGL